MRVLVVATLYPKAYDPALGSFVRTQLLGLQALEVEIAGVVSPVPWSPRVLWWNSRWRAYGEEPRQATDLGGVPVLQPRVPVLPRGLGFALYGRLHAPAVRRAAQRLTSTAPVDLIHAHLAHPDGAAALALGRSWDLPVVITIHGQDLLRSVPRGRLARRLTAQTIHRAERVILVSRKLKEVAEAQGLPGRFEVIPNGIPPAASLDDALVRELEAARPAGARVILSVSNLIERKGHEWVMRGLGLEDHYWIVGEGPHRRRLEELVSSLGLQGRVRFFDAVKPPAVAAFMRAADVFALPSTAEALGVVYLEAMRARLPVIACRGEGEPSLLRHEETALLVPPCDGEAVARALSRLAQEPRLAHRMVTEAHRAVVSHFTLEQRCREQLRVYREVCDAHGRAHDRTAASPRTLW